MRKISQWQISGLEAVVTQTHFKQLYLLLAVNVKIMQSEMVKGPEISKEGINNVGYEYSI